VTALGIAGCRLPPMRIRAVARELQRDPTVMLTEAMRAVVVESVARVAHDRGWRLHAVEAVSSHLHAVIGAPLMGMEVVPEVREAGARLLANRGLHDPSLRFWSRGGHFSRVQTIADLARAVEFVNRHRRHRGEREGASRRVVCRTGAPEDGDRCAGRAVSSRPPGRGATPTRPRRWGSSRLSHRCRSTRRGSSPGTAGGTPRRSRRSARPAARW